jgi:hypothetical protein
MKTALHEAPPARALLQYRRSFGHDLHFEDSLFLPLLYRLFGIFHRKQMIYRLLATTGQHKCGLRVRDKLHLLPFDDRGNCALAKHAHLLFGGLHRQDSRAYLGQYLLEVIILATLKVSVGFQGT